MTYTLKTMTAAAALTLVSGAAFAQTGMNCGEYNAMDAEGQAETMAMMQEGPEGGRENMQDEARGDDGASGGVAVESDSDPDRMNDDNGREGMQNEARGDDEMVAAIADYCEGGDELMLDDMAPGDGVGQ